MTTPHLYWWPVAKSDWKMGTTVFHLKENIGSIAMTVAKLYLMHNRWNVSIKDDTRRELITQMCEQKIADITAERLGA